MAHSEAHRVVVVGAGPRGTSVLERLLARLENGDAPGDRPRRPLEVTVVDPRRPGPGHVWDTGQSRLYLMNTPALFPTVAPPRGGGDAAGLTFDEWRIGGGDGAELSPVERTELAALGAGSFPQRALYGRYLRHVHERVVDRLEALPSVASVRHLRAEAVSLRREDSSYVLEVRDAGGAVGALGADAVVLAVGHVPARPNPRQEAAGALAKSVGLHYQPPNIPADVDWGVYPPGEPVLVRGLGLNFFDVMIQLSVGRGGEFVETGEGPGRALAYRASGREPVLFAASRRGSPYRAKACVDAFIAPSVELVHLSFEAVHALAAEGAPGEPAGKVAFGAHIWPLLHRDVLRTFYATAARVTPELFPAGAGAFMARLDEILDAPHAYGQEVWRTLARDLVEELAPEAGWLDVPALGHPFAERGFASAGEFREAVLGYLEEDARSSARGEDDPVKMAIGALNAGRMVVKRMAAEGLVDGPSWLEELQRWFEPLVEGLASGPPLQRIEELAALVRAGIVDFVGADPVFALDEEAGHFTASSPWVAAPPVESRHMLEAMMPANRVAQSLSPLLVQLQEEGLARPRPTRTSDGDDVPGAGFDVVGEPYRLVDAAGVPHRAVFVLGLQLSSVQWGTAIAAEAGGGWQDGARTIADADAVARELLRLAGT
ncbi:MAG: FAD/NAD(P)-binding protein [Arthrobacter sp.]|uniref:FAD/NAD(P)-binding protein n=1 Tax=Arthrobacter sp. TaxID=1667 RepID=UPI003494AC84